MKAVHLLAAISLALSSLAPIGLAMAKGSLPATEVQNPMDPEQMKYGSGWGITPAAVQPVRLLSEELANLKPAPQERPVKLELDVEPAIYIPGVPIELRWKITNFETIDPKEVSLIFNTQAGVTPQDENLAAQLGKGHSLRLPASGPAGKMDWIIDSTAEMPVDISVQLVNAGQSIDDNSVMVDAAQYDLVQGKKVKNDGSNGNKKAAFDADQSRVAVSAAADSSDEDLAISVHTPSQHKLPYMSLTGEPQEILAVGKKSLRNITKFNTPITIQVKYDPKEHPTWNEDDLQLYYYDDATYDWYPMATTVDKESRSLIAQSDHLTVFDYKASSWQGYVPPTVDNFRVSDFSGAGTYSMGFWVPPAPGGLAPDLSLSYNSQIMDETPALGQSSWVGSGWNLDTGAILRNMHSTNADISDDTFSISMSGISGLLLPVSAVGNVTTYNTASQDYSKITFDSSTNINTWKVYTRNGMVYTFADVAKLYKDGACGTPTLTWRWSLSSVTDVNGKSLTYTYAKDQKTVCSSGQRSDLAVYPQTITYSNGKYRVFFYTEPRSDYQTSWTTNTSLVLYGTKRLQRIQIQMLSGANWVDIRQYIFSYRTTVTNDINDPIYPRSPFSNNNGLTLTLAGVQEVGNGGTAMQPATTFYYPDKMHLGRVDNGQGGQVDLSYERVTFFDDINKAQRSIYANYLSGSGQTCTTTNWSSVQGTLRCDPPTNYLQVGDTAATGKANRTIPEAMIKPGARYRLRINARPFDAGVTTNLNYGLIDESNNATAYYSNPALSTSTGPQELSVDMPVTFKATQTRLRLECLNKGCFMREFALIEFLSYFRVLTRTVTDKVNNMPPGQYTYHYDEEAPNNGTNSEAIALGTVYTTENSEFRGHSLSEVVDPQGLAAMTFYYQNDTLKGQAYRSLVLKQTFYDDLNSMVAGPNSSDWTASGYVSGSGVLSTDATITTSTLIRTVAMNGSMAFAQLRLDSGYASAQGEVGLFSANGKFFGLVAKPATGGFGLYVRTDTGSGMTDASAPLVPAGTFSLNKWYGVLLIADAANGFRVRAWQMGDLSNTAYESVVSGYPLDTWKLRAKVSNGVLEFDTPAEGTLFSESTTRYNVTTQVSHSALQVTSLRQYNDLNVVWTSAAESVARTYDGKSTWSGTRTTMDYNTDDQGGQYGNATRLVYSAWNGSAWVDDHAAKTQYYPNTAGNPYLVSLPARSVALSCTGNAGNGADCDFTGESGLLGETLNIYDSNTTYNSPPATGLLKKQRVLLDIHPTLGALYGETAYTYDVWGNQTGVTSYSGYGTAGSSPISGARSTNRTYDTTYNTYVVSETNALTQTVQTVYDYALGLPITVTDANNVNTTASYDGFGRMTGVTAPPDSGETLHIAYNNYSSPTSPYNVTLTQRLDATHTMTSVRYYSGLGKLIQSQTLGAAVNGSTQNIVQDSQYDSLGRLVKQTKPYTYSTSSAFQVQSFSQPLVTTTYDILSRVTQVLDANGTHSDTSYDGLNATQIDPLGNSTTRTKDVWGRVVNVNEPLGKNLGYIYDKTGRLIQVNLSQTVLQNGFMMTPTVFTYDIGGRKKTINDPDMGNWSYTYDALGNLETQTDARACVTTLSYDALNRLISKIFSATEACATPAESYYYDGVSFNFLGSMIGGGSGMIGQRTGMQDGSGATTWTYDSRGRKIAENKQMIINSNGGGNQVQTYSSAWSYNSADQPVTITYPDGETVAVGYNAQGMVNSVKKSDNSFTYVNGLTYDEAGRTTNLKLGASGSNPLIQKAYTYFGWTVADMGGRLSGMSATNNASVTLQNLSYTYDKNGNISSNINNILAGGENLQYGYDALNRLTSVSGAAQEWDSYSASGVLQKRTLSTPFTDSFDSQNASWVWTGSQSVDAGALKNAGTGSNWNANFYRSSYSLSDGEGLQVRLKMDQPGVYTQAHVSIESDGTYNRFGVVASEGKIYVQYSKNAGPWTYPADLISNAQANKWYVVRMYLDDQNGFSVKVYQEDDPSKNGSYTTVMPAGKNWRFHHWIWAYNAWLDDYQEFQGTGTYATGGTPAHAVTHVNGVQKYWYDANGNMITRIADNGTYDLTYDAQNRLVEVKLGGATVAVYKYDGDGQRVLSKPAATAATFTAYLGALAEVSYNGSNTVMTKYYYAGAQRVAVSQGGTVSFLLTDHLGSTALTVNTAGAIVAELRYTAWGETRYSSGTTPTSRQFTGQINETAIGLYYYNARFYDSSLGRFIQADTIIPNKYDALAYDRFTYSLNSPINYTDPSGHAQQCPDRESNCSIPKPPTPTPVTRTELSTTSPVTQTGGQQMYDLYLKLFYTFDGWWWDYFGKDGNFTLQDFFVFFFYYEGAIIINGPDANKQLITDFEEGAVRGLYGWCNSAPLLCGSGGSNSLTGKLNFMGAASQSMPSRYFTIFRGQDHGADIYTQFGFFYDFPNDISPKNRIYPGTAQYITNVFFNPSADWKEGWKADRPYEWGNMDLTNPLVQDFLNHPEYVFNFSGNFVIPTGLGNNNLP